MVIVALITLAVLLIVAGVRRFGTDSRDGRDWRRPPSSDLDESHPWTAGYRDGPRLHDVQARQETLAGSRQRGLFG
ncbi:hypothetical protein I6A60_23760 [Frankia sp. AgB1.9]|jgi:hypothetical protein|uniref:hypothetical protein n=1 Tax=unclassified Frankia TaxID=2632575 RepID=UPI0019346E26|nr:MULTISPECIES: hypothetical protein [unclassified Frankia]MBL7490914.1 hypothetical protein [Frankia sp. AgW1.1]MBL7550861.1 hypothetical protein [Frankia sp. AgB1.9]MBL7623197.1 hypothetical protein [Frankia sp. AgB1.8]